MNEGLKTTNSKQTPNDWQSLHIEELEEKTKHLTGASKEEKKMRILEHEKGVIIPQADRMIAYEKYILEVLEKESEENKLPKILEILEKDGVFTKEEIETLMIAEKAVEQGGMSNEDEKEIETIIEKNKETAPWLKKIMMLGTLIAIPFKKLNKNKNKLLFGSLTALSLNKMKDNSEQNIFERIKQEKEYEIEKKEAAKKAQVDSSKTAIFEKFEKTKTDSIEKIPTALEKPIEFFKGLEFIKGNFYVLDKSDRTKPTVYEITKDGKIISKEVVGIGKEEGDGTKGHTTPAGIYRFTKWLKKEDIELYGKDKVLRLLGYSINGEQVMDMGFHGIYPNEQVDRTVRLLDVKANKGMSMRCINTWSEYIENNIEKNYNKQGGEGKLVSELFIAVMQEKDDFNEAKWKKIAKKMEGDSQVLKEAEKTKN